MLSLFLVYSNILVLCFGYLILFSIALIILINLVHQLLPKPRIGECDDGSWAIITGATDGIGLAFAKVITISSPKLSSPKISSPKYKLYISNNIYNSLFCWEPRPVPYFDMTSDLSLGTTFISFKCFNKATGIGGRGYFWYTPPWPKIFRKYPLEILRQAAILFFK